MKTFSAWFLLLALMSAPAFGAICDESCTDPSDCVVSGCPVCVGTCVACADLGDESSCTNSASGASTHCSWDGSACSAGAAVPELPDAFRYLFLLLFGALGIYFARRKRGKACLLLYFALSSFQGAQAGSSAAALQRLSDELSQRLDRLSRKVATAARAPRGLQEGALCNGRLTTESGNAASSSDRTAQSTLYFTPYRGATLALYNGSDWALLHFNEFSLALSSLTSGANYDVFAYSNSGTPTLELSSAWASSSARTDALTTLEGVLVKSSNNTRRYLGTIRTTGTNTVEDSMAKRFVWNHCNRITRPMAVTDSTTNWNYGSTTPRAANNSTSNRLQFVSGQADARVFARNKVYYDADSASSPLTASCGIGIGLDSTTADSSSIRGPDNFNSGINSPYNQGESEYTGYPGAGFHYLQWIEFANDRCDFYGLKDTYPFGNGILGSIDG